MGFICEDSDSGSAFAETEEQANIRIQALIDVAQSKPLRELERMTRLVQRYEFVDHADPETGGCLDSWCPCCLRTREQGHSEACDIDYELSQHPELVERLRAELADSQLLSPKGDSLHFQVSKP